VYYPNLDFAMVEYDNDNNMVAAMARLIKVEYSTMNLKMGMKKKDSFKDLYQTTYIFPKSNIRFLEMNIDNNVLTSNLHKVLFATNTEMVSSTQGTSQDTSPSVSNKSNLTPNININYSKKTESKLTDIELMGQKSKQLQQLYKDGVITKEEYKQGVMSLINK